MLVGVFVVFFLIVKVFVQVEFCFVIFKFDVGKLFGDDVEKGGVEVDSGVDDGYDDLFLCCFVRFQYFLFLVELVCVVEICGLFFL